MHRQNGDAPLIDDSLRDGLYSSRMIPHRLLHDILFKIVFGGQDSEPVLRALLNALLGYTGGKRIVELTIQNPTFDKAYIDDKEIFLDIRATDREGRHFNVEVQLSLGKREAYIKRSIYYAATMIADQLDRGEDYRLLNKTICISLVDFVLFKDKEHLHSTFHFREEKDHALLTDVVELHYIEFPKFSASKPDHLRTPFEKWLHILKFSENYAASDEPLPANLQEEEGISMAIDSLKKACADDEVRELIRMRAMARKDYVTAINIARDDGREEGREEGLKEGLKQAEQERQRAEQLAKRLRELGVDPDTL